MENGSKPEPQQPNENPETTKHDTSEEQDQNIDNLVPPPPPQPIVNSTTGEENDSETHPPAEIEMPLTNVEDGVQLEPTEENPATTKHDTSAEQDRNIDNLVPPPPLQPIVNSATGEENDSETHPPAEIEMPLTNMEDGVQLEPTEENPDTAKHDTSEEQNQNIENLVPPQKQRGRKRKKDTRKKDPNFVPRISQRKLQQKDLDLEDLEQPNDYTVTPMKITKLDLMDGNEVDETINHEKEKFDSIENRLEKPKESIKLIINTKQKTVRLKEEDSDVQKSVTNVTVEKTKCEYIDMTSLNTKDVKVETLPGHTRNKLMKPISNRLQHSKLMQSTYTKPVVTKEDGRFHCSICAWHYKKTLNTHIKVHYELGKYDCSICGCNFYNINEWQHHEVSHSDDRKFQCAMCGKKFKTTSGLDDHSRNCKVGKNKDEVKMVQCDHCQKTFESEVSLRVHLRNVFQGPYVCKPCKKVYKQFLSYWRHQKEKH